jgi:hypothetical protein
MSAVVSTIDIARTPAEVFAYATDPRRFGEWQKDVVNVRLLDDRPLGVGSLFATTRQIGRTRRTMTQQITEVAPDRHWAAAGIDGPVRVTGTVDVEPTDDGRHSRVTFTLSFEGRGIGKVIVPLFVVPQARKGSPYSYRNLKERLETPDSPA